MESKKLDIISSQNTALYQKDLIIICLYSVQKLFPRCSNRLFLSPGRRALSVYTLLRLVEFLTSSKDMPCQKILDIQKELIPHLILCLDGQDLGALISVLRASNIIKEISDGNTFTYQMVPSAEFPDTTSRKYFQTMRKKSLKGLSRLIEKNLSQSLKTISTSYTSNSRILDDDFMNDLIREINYE